MDIFSNFYNFICEYQCPNCFSYNIKHYQIASRCEDCGYEFRIK